MAATKVQIADLPEKPYLMMFSTDKPAVLLVLSVISPLATLGSECVGSGGRMLLRFSALKQET